MGIGQCESDLVGARARILKALGGSYSIWKGQRGGRYGWWIRRVYIGKNVNTALEKVAIWKECNEMPSIEGDNNHDEQL